MSPRFDEFEAIEFHIDKNIIDKGLRSRRGVFNETKIRGSFILAFRESDIEGMSQVLYYYQRLYICIVFDTLENKLC